jgi:hypothetical protein
MADFQPQHVERTRVIHLEAPPDVVFPLFEPLGEKRWVDGWDPDMLFPATGETVEGGVFTTRHDGEETIWTVALYAPAQRHVRYVRTTPGSRTATVEVRCEPEGDGGTRAQVTYAMTALTEAGNRYIEEFTEAHYNETIDSWQELIGRALRNEGETSA